MATTEAKGRKRAAPAACASTQSESMQLTCALNTFNKSSEVLLKAITDLEQTKDVVFGKIEVELNDRKRQRSAVEEEYEHLVRAKKIDADQDIAEHGFTKAKEFLENKGFVPVEQDKYNALVEEVAVLRKKTTEELQAAVDAEKKAERKRYEGEKRVLELEHKAVIAELTAESKQLHKTIAGLREDIVKAEANVAAQRDLTKEVAVACKAPSVTVNSK